MGCYFPLLNFYNLLCSNRKINTNFKLRPFLILLKKTSLFENQSYRQKRRNRERSVIYWFTPQTAGTAGAGLGWSQELHPDLASRWEEFKFLGQLLLPRSTDREPAPILTLNPHTGRLHSLTMFRSRLFLCLKGQHTFFFPQKVFSSICFGLIVNL